MSRDSNVNTELHGNFFDEQTSNARANKLSIYLVIVSGEIFCVTYEPCTKLNASI